MPELPEVETVKRGIIDHVQHKIVRNVIIRCHQLRWPVPDNLPALITDKRVENLSRRGKYLLFHFAHGSMILHLGMSGVLRLLDDATPLKKHDHIDFHFNNDVMLRYNDTRRFGAVLWTEEPTEQHALLSKLGPEPLSDAFSAEYLFNLTRKRTMPIKSLIMNSHCVVGVGNIYANESLFSAGIHPAKPADQLNLSACEQLTHTIKTIISQAIEAGGTTLKDFRQSDGKPGYFSQSLQVYGRGGQPCQVCDTVLSSSKLGQRQTVFCLGCQR